MKNSHASASIRWCGLNPYRLWMQLVVPLGREIPLRRDHPALARARGRPGHRRALRERHLRLERERAEAHARDVDRDVELDRLLREARPEHGLRLALLPVALDHEPGQRPRQEHQVVPVRDLLEHREPAHAVAAELGLHVDVVEDLRREDRAAAEARAVRGLSLADVAAELVVAVGRRHRHQLPLGGLEVVVVVELLAADELLEFRRRAEAVDRELALDRARCRRPSTRPARSRSRATSPCRRRRSSRRTSSRRGRGRRRRRGSGGRAGS